MAKMFKEESEAYFLQEMANKSDLAGQGTVRLQSLSYAVVETHK